MENSTEFPQKLKTELPPLGLGGFGEGVLGAARMDEGEMDQLQQPPRGPHLWIKGLEFFKGPPGMLPNQETAEEAVDISLLKTSCVSIKYKSFFSATLLEV